MTSTTTSVFCLGPIEARDGSAFAAFAFANGRMQQPVFAANERACLAELRRRHQGATLCCEPELADVADALGLEVRELPDDVLAVRAGMAVQLAIGHAFAPTVKPAFVMELIAASREFLASVSNPRLEKPFDRAELDAVLTNQLTRATS